MERFVRDEIARRYRSISRFLRETDYPNASFYRVIADAPVATHEQFRHLEGVLNLPRGVLDYICDVNVPALRRAGLEHDQLRVILEELSIETSTPSGETKDEELFRLADEQKRQEK